MALYFLVKQLIPVARTQEILKDVFGLSMSTGTLCNLTQECGAQLRRWEVQIRSQIQKSGILHVDETGMRCEKRSDWVHVYSTGSHTLLALNQKRGKEAIDEIALLKHFKGHLVHDAFAPYWNYAKTHSLCNAHILRELSYLTEEERQRWSDRMAKALKKALRDQHRRPVRGAAWLTRVRREYRACLKLGYRENGYPNEWKSRPPDYYKTVWENGKRLKVPRFKQRSHSIAMKLLNRMRDREDEILAFAKDPRVPFTNNQAERDLRMLKLKQKISGCFRSASMGRHFLRIRSFVATLQKQGSAILPALEAQFASV
jgi:transposase